MVLIDLPAALPGIVTGLRLGVTAAMLVTITSEMLLSTNGLGAFVQRSQESLQVATGLAGIVAIAIMGLVINMGLRVFEDRLLFWHYRVKLSEVGVVDDAAGGIPLATRAATIGAGPCGGRAACCRRAIPTGPSGITCAVRARVR